jgi:hypothetical protein
MLGEVKMNVKLMIIVFLFISATAQAVPDNAKDKRTDYKCHFELAKGVQVVGHVMSKKNYVRQLQQELAGKAIFAKDGVTKRQIFQVFECVEGNKTFKSSEAQALDAVTLS